MSTNGKAEQNPIQQRFIELLRTLTGSGKLEWAQAAHDPGFIYCLADKELIVFEVRGPDAAPILPTGQVEAISSKCRNIVHGWLPVSEGFESLLELLRSAPVDDKRFAQMRRLANSAPIDALEALLKS